VAGVGGDESFYLVGASEENNPVLAPEGQKETHYW
jgi:hypothetical protein